MKGRNAFTVLMGKAHQEKGTNQPRFPGETRPSASVRPPPCSTRACGGTQLHLDLGQRDFAVATCPTCGMMYGKGLPEEERLHAQFHSARTAAFRFQGWVSERVVMREGRSRLLVWLPGDPPQQLKKVAQVCGQVEEALGVPEGYLLAPKPPCKVFLWVSSDGGGEAKLAASSSGPPRGGGGASKSRIVGVLVTQLQDKARWCSLSVQPPPSKRTQPQQQRLRQLAIHVSADAAAAPGEGIGRTVRDAGVVEHGDTTGMASMEEVAEGTVQRQFQTGGGEETCVPQHEDAADLDGGDALEASSQQDGRGGDKDGDDVAIEDAGSTGRPVKRSRGENSGTMAVGLEEGPPSTSQPSPRALATGAGGSSTGPRSAVGDGGTASAAVGRTAAVGATGSAAVSVAAGSAAAAGSTVAGASGRRPDGVVRSVVGVRGLWVEPGCRRQGVARRMLDAARSCMVPGFAAARDQTAFSAVAVAAAAGDDDGGAAFVGFALSYTHGRSGEVQALLYDDAE